MRILVWVVSGLAAGWGARLLLRSRPRLGMLGDLILGLLGGICGGRIFAALGVVAADHPLAHALVALCGAVLLIGGARLVVHAWTRSASLAPPVARAALSLGEGIDAEIRRLGGREKRVVSLFLRRERAARDAGAEFEESLSAGQRVADRVAAFGGSWTFIGLFVLLMALWMTVNTEGARRFDPYPFILLNLVLSCMAALQAPVIMMSQNRQAEKDRRQASADYVVNLKAEMEIMAMSARLDELRAGEMSRLLALHEQTVKELEALRLVVEQRLDAEQPGAKTANGEKQP